MEERRITKAEFDAAVTATTEKLIKDDRLNGMAAFLVPMVGMTFARDMRDILFPDDETEGSEEC